MSNKRVEERGGPMKDAYNIMGAWLDQLMYQNSFVLSSDMARLDVNKQQFALLFGISIDVQERILNEGASLLVTGHGNRWAVTAVRLDEILGKKQVTVIKKTYQLLLEYIELNPGEVDKHLLRQEAIRLYNFLPPGTQQVVMNPHTAFSNIPE